MAVNMPRSANLFQSLLRPFLRNPVVMRDLRVQLRGTRAFVQIAAFLFILAIIALAGYSVASNSSGNSIVQVQDRMQGFYRFIFLTLAALITLIAPALTASTVTSEKQAQTLDLLMTTPLTAMELLLGKLMSSVAFIGLLLFISVPVSTLCVLLGGATLWDVFQVYLFFIIDGFVFAGIGLYFSCYARNSLEAMSSTYGTLIMVLLITVPFAASVLIPSGAGRSATTPLFALAALNPFIAVEIGGRGISIGSLQIPTFIGTALIAFLTIRLLITSATFRIGQYGTSAMPSLRRQVLVLVAMVTGIGFYALAETSAFSSLSGVAAISLGFIFLLTVFFMPPLFVPGIREDAEAGALVVGAYQPRKLWQAEHAGALPYFHLWLFVFIGSAMAGIAIQIQLATGSLSGLFANPARLSGSPSVGITDSTLNSAPMWFYLFALTFYLSALGWLAWCISRFAIQFVVGTAAARALAFGILMIFGLAPLMFPLTFKIDFGAQVMRFVWILWPLVGSADTSRTTNTIQDMFVYGAVIYGLGILFHPPWKAVRPAIPQYARRTTPEGRREVVGEANAAAPTSAERLAASMRADRESADKRVARMDDHG